MLNLFRTLFLGERPHEDIIKKYTDCEHKGEYKGTDIQAK